MSSPETRRDDAQKGLGKTINSSTRLLHRTLNKLILERLPLALPPRVSNPSQYTTGILHIASVYIAFETLWRQVLTKPVAGDGTAGHPWWARIIEFPVGLPRRTHFESYAELPPKLSEEGRDSVHELLTGMHMPKLERAARLVADIRALTGWTRDEVAQEIRLLTSAGDDNDNETGLAAFVKHTASSVALAPHVLLAHGWVMYMALFSGGRYIRATLETATGLPDALGRADPSFWAADPGPVPPGMRPGVRASSNARAGSVDAAAAQAEDDDSILGDGGHPSCVRFVAGEKDPDPRRSRLPLDFLHFATRRDGEDLKEDFKCRLEAAAPSLSAAQQDDVINEARRVFQFLIRIVGDLDGICGAATPTPPSDGRVSPCTLVPSPRGDSSA
ncbi:hypothetical protein RB595_002788 [Gaeumannomyces hyphopodioides]